MKKTLRRFLISPGLAPAHRADEDIRRALFELVASSELADQLDTIAFVVRERQVTLTGELRRWGDIPQLIQLARQVPGVRRVDEFLHRRGESPGEAAIVRRSQLGHWTGTAATAYPIVAAINHSEPLGRRL